MGTGADNFHMVFNSSVENRDAARGIFEGPKRMLMCEYQSASAPAKSLKKKDACGLAGLARAKTLPGAYSADASVISFGSTRKISPRAL